MCPCRHLKSIPLSYMLHQLSSDIFKERLRSDSKMLYKHVTKTSSLLQHVEQKAFETAPSSPQFPSCWPTAITLALHFNTEFSVFDTTLECPMYTDLGTGGSVRNEVQDNCLRKIWSCEHTGRAEVHLGFLQPALS